MSETTGIGGDHSRPHRGDRDVLVLVDETKRRSYLMVAVYISLTETTALRARVRRMTLPGQRRLHMQSESDPRRRRVVSALVDAPITAVIYDGGRRQSERVTRAACLRSMVTAAVELRVTRVIIERDDSMLSLDNQCLVELAHQLDEPDRFPRYEHLKAFDEPLLALPDVVAWCWARGPDWRMRIAPLVDRVVPV